MARKEAALDLWVADRLTECDIEFTSQGSNIKEIDNALKDASKRGTGNAGYPEYVSKIGRFVLVIEDKASQSRHEKLTDSDILDMSTEAVTDYAVNGAYHYASHIAKKSPSLRSSPLGFQGTLSITPYLPCS